MSDAPLIINVQQTDVSSPLNQEESVFPMRPPLIRDLSHEEQNSSRRGLVRRDTLEDKSSASRRSSVDTLKSISKKRMSLNVSSASPTQARRPSKFRETNDALLQAPGQFLRKTTLTKKRTLRASPTLVERSSKKGGSRVLKARSTKELADQSMDSNFSELEDLQHLYHKQKRHTKNELPTSGTLTDLSPTTEKTKKISMTSRITQMYYQMMRKKITRSGTQVYPDTSEFLEHIQEIKDNVRTPNMERVKDIVIVDQDPLEKLRTYQDKYPFLKARKAAWRVKTTIALIAKKIIVHPIFEYFILAVIIANSIILAMDDPTVAGTGSAEVDNLLLAIYTVECVLKIVGLGFFFNTGAYLRDVWNILDFVIVVTGYIPIFFASDGLNLQAFRALRVLRPLKTVSNIEALRVIIVTLIGAFGPLMETLLILLFVYLVFAIGGLQLFSGLLKKRCFSELYGTPWYDEDENADNNEKYCNTDDDCGVYNGLKYVCGKMVKNPNNDITNFDTIQNSYLMVFQIVTMEGWSDIMLMLEKTFTTLSAFYFVLLIVICGFFLLNLTLAVLKVKFTENAHEEPKEKDPNEKYWAHGEKYFYRTEYNKRDILKLMEKRKNDEIIFDKYEMKKECLTALEADKARKIKAGVTRRRKRVDSNGKMGWLRNTIITNFIHKNPAKKGVVALASAAKRLALMISRPSTEDTKRSSSLRKVHSLKNTDSTSTGTPQILITAKTRSLKKSDTKGENPTEQPLTEKPDPNSTNKPLLTNSPLSPLSDSLQANSPIRPIETSRLLITPSQAPRSPSKGDNSPEVNKTPSLVIIPSIAEANEKSEQSLGTITSKNFLGVQVQRNNFFSNTLKTNSPIRPHLAEKVHVKTDTDQKGDSVAIINIAGIRNKAEQQKQKPKFLTKGTFVLDATPVPDSKEISFNNEESVFDLLEAKSPTPQRSNPRVSQNQNTILKQINQIKKPTQVKPRKSRLSAQHRLSELVSVFDLGDEDDLDKLNDGNAPTGILDDSDFFDEKQRVELIRRKKMEKVARRKLNGGRSPTKRLTQNKLTSFGHLPESRVFKGESHTHIAHKKFVRGSVDHDRSSMMNKISYDDDDDDERFVIDIRYLKAVPAFERDYHATCEDDVLPARKERERKRVEEQEVEDLKNTRLKMEFKITAADERRARERLDSHYSRSDGGSSLVGTSKSKRHRSIESQLSRIGFETNNSKQTLNRNSTKNFSKKKTYNPSSNHHVTGTSHRGERGGQNIKNQVGNDDDYIKPDKMNDFFEILGRIEKPFDNEDKMDHQDHQEKMMKDFKLNDEYRQIRRNDLKTDKIGEINWSGDNVLNQTNAYFAVNRVKMALNKQDFDIWRPGYWGLIHGFRRTVKHFVESNIFNNFIMLSVFLNTLILATEGLINDTATANLLSSFNLAFTIIFTIEMGLKLIAYGIIGYVNDKMNLFDAAVVIISLVELIFLSGSGTKSLSAFRTIRLFRTFRVLRVTKLLRSLRYMQFIIAVIGRSLKKFIYIFVLLFLFIFIYTLLGMQLFGGSLDLAPDDIGHSRIRQNFDTFFNAWMTVFQIMTLENWNDILFLSIRSTSVNTLISILYLISWIWIGNYIMLNLFLAILLDEFTGDDSADEYEELDTQDDGGDTYSMTSRSQTLDKNSKSGTHRTLSIDSSHHRTGNSRMDDDLADDGESSKDIKDHKTQLRICEKSLYFISKNNIVRKTCLKIIQHRYFDRLILTMIVLSSIKLAVDSYYDDTDNPVIEVSNTIDDALTIFFAVEAVLKIISLGFFVDAGCYLRDSWNQLDFIIVVSAILDMSIEAVNLSFIKILRLLRTLRPLRFVTHNKDMRLIVTALVESVGALLNVIIVVLLIWLMFGILAINIVGSKLGYCENMPEGVSYYSVSKTACATTYAAEGAYWVNPTANFDNIFEAIMTLFIMSTLENWPGILFTVVDANDASEGPIEGNQRVFAYIYFMIFIFVGAFFLVNLFIGVISLEFTRAQQRENHLKKFLTTDQQNWVIMQRLLLAVKPDVSNVEPKNPIMRKVFRVINHTKFEIFIMTIILLNIMLMAITYEGSSDGYNLVLKYINWCFSGIFIGELLLKHVGLGFRRYWANGWNRFDAFVVVASLFDIVTDVMSTSFFSFIRVGPQLARVFRVLRVSRLLKLVKQFEGLQKILNTLLFTLPSLLNVGALLFLVYFIYSVLSTYIFKEIKEGQIIDGVYVHFQDFGTAMINLFRCSTGENWWIIMYDTVTPTGCNDGTTTCGTWAAYPFWLSFIVVCQFIFINLFVLVVLQQFEDYHLNDDNPVNTFSVVMENNFKPAWEELALRHGGTHIHLNQLVEFFQKLPYPWGFKGSAMSKIEISKTIMRLEIPQDFDNMFYYNDIVFTVFKHGFNVKQTEEPDRDQHRYLAIHEEKTLNKLKALKKNTILTPSSLRRKSTVKELNKTKRSLGANPIERMLFMGMTMRCWLKYAEKITEKKKAAEENGYDYIDSESDQNDYTFYDPNASPSDRSPSVSDSEDDDQDRKKYSGYIKEEDEAESDDDAEKQSLIDIENTERNLKDGEEKDYIFNGDMSPSAYDDEHTPNYNIAHLAFKHKNNRLNQRNPDGTKITITSHSTIRGASHYELDKVKSGSRLTPQKLVKFVQEGDLGELAPKASYSFLEPDVSPKRFESKKSSKSNLEDGEKANVVNVNINNNVIINNNYFINSQQPPENPEIAAASPVSRETSITIERNINITRSQGQASRFGSQNRDPILNSKEELNEEGSHAKSGSKDNTNE